MALSWERGDAPWVRAAHQTSLKQSENRTTYEVPTQGYEEWHEFCTVGIESRKQLLRRRVHRFASDEVLTDTVVLYTTNITLKILLKGI
jgi:hypothetical protein